MKRIWGVMVVVMASSACSKHVVSGPMPPSTTRKPLRSAVTTAFERHARGAVDAGDGDYRIRQLREKLTAEPNNLAARMELADRYQQAGYSEIALEHYRLATERFPNSEEAAIAAARMLRKAGALRDAAEVLNGLRMRGSASAPARAWLGLIHDELQEYAAAEEHHRAALAVTQSDWLHNNLGYNLLLQGRNDEAAAEFRKALALAPHSQVAHNNLGLALSSDPEKALSAWREVNGPAAAHNNMATVHIRNGRYTEARQELQRALGYKKDQPEVLSNLRLLEQIDGTTAVLPEGRKQRWNWFARMLFGAPFEESKADKAAGNEGVKTAHSSN